MLLAAQQFSPILLILMGSVAFLVGFAVFALVRLGANRPCPDCRKRISRRSRTCPYCGGRLELR